MSLLKWPKYGWIRVRWWWSSPVAKIKWWFWLSVKPGLFKCVSFMCCTCISADLHVRRWSWWWWHYLWEDGLTVWRDSQEKDHSLRWRFNLCKCETAGNFWKDLMTISSVCLWWQNQGSQKRIFCDPHQMFFMPKCNYTISTALSHTNNGI